MTLRSLLGAGAATAAVLAAPALAVAAPTNLPTVQRTATAASLTSASCAATRASRGTDHIAYTAPAEGYLTVRTAGGAGSDWDLALLDATAKRTLVSSMGFGADELAQLWVTKGQRITAQACRRAGSSDTLQVRFNLLKSKISTDDRTVSVINVKYKSFAELDVLEAAGIDVTHKNGGGSADILVTGAKQLGALRATGMPYEVEIPDMAAYDRSARRQDAAYAASVDASPLPSGRTSYRVYTDFQSEMKTLVAEHPNLVKPLMLPKKSVLGRDVEGVEISNNVKASDDGKPVYFVMGVHHAREWPSAEIAMEFAIELATSKSAAVKQLLDQARVLVVPIINPDGFIASRGSVSAGDTTNQSLVQTAEAIMPPGGYLAYRRKNCGGLPVPGLPCELQYGIDPNRNYGEGWGGNGAGSDPNTQSYRGPGPWSEPETQNVHELSQRRQVTGLITLHTIGALVLRPPGRSTFGKAPDENETKRIGDIMGAAAGYPSQYSFQLYDTSGTTEDWNYAAAGTYGYTIEIGPQGGQFHGPYNTNVVEQWTGAKVNVPVGQPKGLGDALIFAGLESTAPKTHGVLNGTATPGRTLRVKRSFQTSTAPVCTYAQGYLNSTGIPPAARPVNCLEPGKVRPAEKIDDFVESTTKVSQDGTFTWHVGPSTRPFVGGKYDDDLEKRVPTGVTEAWTFTCEDETGKVLDSREVTIDRGEVQNLGALGC